MQLGLRKHGAASVLFTALLIAPLAGICVAEDVIEFLTGAKVVGEVTSIDKEKKLVTFSAKIGERNYQREYTYSKIHAVTYQGKRFVLNAMGTGAAGAGGAGSNAAKPRSKAEVLELVKQAGSAPPEWYDSTPVEHPKSLDLSWPEPAPGPWDNQKNMGQYIWDIINPNPGRWRSGIRLIHHLMAMHKDDPAIRQRAMRALGEKYFIFFQDYARAAFWWQQAGVGFGGQDSVYLAECYWRLGNQVMAQELLVDPERLKQGNNPLRAEMIKLWGDMGQLNKALKLTEVYLRSGGDAHTALLMAGDACRTAGRFTDALKFYQRAVDTPDPGNGRADRNIKRARANLEAVRLFELSNVSKARDGTHTGTSPAYEGPLTVEIDVSGGRLNKVEVTKHTEKQFYSAITDVPQQIIAKQGVKGIDATSRATITAEAIINATAKALAENQK
jgi:uncharacterized protein with FMN-binding domain